MFMKLSRADCRVLMMDVGDMSWLRDDGSHEALSIVVRTFRKPCAQTYDSPIEPGHVFPIPRACENVTT